MSSSLRLIIFLISLAITMVIFLFWPQLNFRLPVKISSAPNLSIKPPTIVKAIYLTNYSAGSSKKIQEVLTMAQNGTINSVVIDIKDWSGYIDYDAKIPGMENYQNKRILINDLPSLVRILHQNNIYVIGRIVVFEDPVLAENRPDLAIHRGSINSSLWRDRSGLAWLDPSSKDVWDYNIAIAKDTLLNGFDEINFDYIRFPSDGKLSNMVFPFWDKKIPKEVIINNFFAYLRTNLPGAKLSVDLFGYTTVNYDDLGIGQIIEGAFPYFDYICPMVYPSHYNSGFLGYKNPAEFPYQVIKKSMETAQKRLDIFNQSQPSPAIAKLRPWLQDFNLGAIYNAKMIKEQIRATDEALGDNYNGFILWNAKNIYNEESLK